MPPVVHRSHVGAVEWLAEGGLALGVEEGVAFKSATTRLEPGDLLILYSDGVTEAPRHGRPFGQGKFSDLVTDYGRGSCWPVSEREVSKAGCITVTQVKGRRA